MANDPMIGGETLSDYMKRMVDRDAAKHPGSPPTRSDGMRSTTDVAEFFHNYSPATIRRHLHRLWEAGVIEAFDGGASGHQGNAIDWRYCWEKHNADKLAKAATGFRNVVGHALRRAGHDEVCALTDDQTWELIKAIQGIKIDA